MITDNDFRNFQQEIRELDARITASVILQSEQKHEDHWTKEMERTMDKLALLAAKIYDITHRNHCKYDVNDPKYSRSMQRRMRNVLGMFDQLDQNYFRCDQVAGFTKRVKETING